MAGVIKLARITRVFARQHLDHIFVFGDNMKGVGFGGLAAELRGEPHAVGIPTKWSPGRAREDYFSNHDWQSTRVGRAIMEPLARLDNYRAAGTVIVLPEGGIGTGLAELPQRAPVIYHYIAHRLALLELI